MSAITYTAVDRGTLITDSPAHIAGNQYSIDVKLQQFSESIDMPKSTHVSIGGNIETVLQRASNLKNIVLIWPDQEDTDMQEFLYSIAGGETLSFDAYGTVSVADDPVDVVCMNTSFAIGRMTHGKVHWRSVALVLRPAL